MPRRDGLRIWKILKKDSVEVRPGCWEVGVRTSCWEVKVRPWCWEVGVRPCCWEVEVRPCSWGLTLDHAGRQLSLYHWGIDNWILYRWRMLLEFCRSLNLKNYKMRCAFVASDSTVSIVRIVSLLVSKNQSQKLINRSYLRQKSPTCVFVPGYFHL